MAARLLCAGRRALGLACAHCFPAGTLVATPGGGLVAIQTLRVGQTVLAEDPTTGLVAPEAVQAVLADPVSPLVAVDLSDGSAITATADHPFWVDAGALFAGHNWLAAGDLLPGDRLRTANGKDARVVRVRRGVGRATVYTLTVATDHTFFVGSASVLVHNGTCSVVVRTLRAKASTLAPGMIVTNVSRSASRQGFVAEITYAGNLIILTIPRPFHTRVYI